MIFSVIEAFRATRRFPDYRPRPVTFRSVWKWLSQFPNENRKELLRLLGKVIYFSEAQTCRALVDLNQELLMMLIKEGITPESIVYVQVAEAGSSSGVMLNMLRDASNLEKRGCQLLDCKDMLNLHKVTAQLGSGAIVYVDDFAGTGDQFCRSRDAMAQCIPENFVEFFLLPCICEEAVSQLDTRGIRPICARIHRRHERPLHKDCDTLSIPTKAHLIKLCGTVNGREGTGLGYEGMATMVVFYRNAPNSLPSALRGNYNKTGYHGLFPRHEDLPIKSV